MIKPTIAIVSCPAKPTETEDCCIAKGLSDRWIFIKIEVFFVTGISMASLTIELSDEVMEQLAPLQAQLPELIVRFIVNPILKFDPAERPALQPDIYHEILDFLVSSPKPEQILNFKVSEPSQIRLQQLLENNRNLALSPNDRSELDLYQQLDFLMGLLKARAYRTIHSSPSL